MIDRRPQIRDFDRRSAGPRLSLAIIKTHYCILVRHVELVSDQRQAVRCVQVLGKDGFFFVSAVAISVVQQRQTIAAGDMACAFRLYDAGNYIFRRQFRFVASFSFGNQNISIRQNESLAQEFSGRWQLP